jgi:predicted chitinase
LLRFGRIVNNTNETLTPADVPHWREIILPTAAGASTQTAWVNLNNQNGAHTVRVFSDADFPHWRGWKICDDDASVDSRCDAAGVKRLLDEDGDGNITPTERRTRMVMPEVQEAMRRVICSFPTEWNSATIDAHWSWLKTQTVENPEPLSDEDFTRFGNHLRALCFTSDDLITATRHFHPRGFIEQFRKCSWLKVQELAATCPRYMFYNTDNPAAAFTQAGNLYTLTLQTAITRLAPYTIHLNRCIRKYVEGKQRTAFFLSQVLLETDRWRTHSNYGLLREHGYGTPNNAVSTAIQYYAAFFGRGIMQLTWAGNYKVYGTYKNIPNHQGAYVERRQNIQPRITATSQHYSSNPQVHHQDGSITIDNTKLFQWSPRYDPDIISENAHYACDSGGYFWVSTPIPSSQTNLNRLADRVYSANNIREISRVVNGGGNGYTDRQAYSAFMLRYLTDDANTSATVAIPAVQPRPAVTANMAVAE